MIEWNTVKYIDCMDEKEGLPSLPNKSIDLGITDIFFNIGINVNIDNKGYPTISKKSVLYNDNIKDYKKVCSILLNYLLRICNGVIIYCGGINLSMWCNIKEPRQIIYRLSRNSASRGIITYFMNVFPLVCYGKFNKRLKLDSFEYPSYNGWMRKTEELIHPYPLNNNFWYDIISQLKPKSVIDPFIGSGTTAEVCKKLNIPWIGYEINPVYKHDIDLRLNQINTKKSDVLHWLKNKGV